MKFALIDGNYKITQEDLVTIKDTLTNLPGKELAVIALRMSGFSQQETAHVVAASRTSVGTIEKVVTGRLKEAVN